MSKSYRKPYGTWVCSRVSEHDLKTICSRIYRRAQEQAVHKAFCNDDWDSFILPVREEGKLGSEYDLRRDGHKRPLHRGKQYNNPFAYWYCHSGTEEEIIALWEDRKRHDDEYMAWVVRK